MNTAGDPSAGHFRDRVRPSYYWRVRAAAPRLPLGTTPYDPFLDYDPFSERSNPSGSVPLYGGSVVHQVEPVGQTRDLEYSLHRLRSLDDRQAPPVVASALVRPHHAPEPGGVEERELGEVENEDTGVRLLPAHELLIDLANRREIQLAPERDVYEAVALLGLHLEDRHRVNLPSRPDRR